MRQRRPDTLEVHVSFEVTRLAATYLIDAYQLLVPTASQRKPTAPELTSTSRTTTSAPAPEEKVG